ncbi:MAG: hypothetical protein CVT48_02740 [Thermoplasmata archaeon HGW-Thermoplasmata-1]|nr:MAG: hypothetical protein CVT48_02740 [Thermoplasmata archaeon HGW-Thermoplasmata-1]
MAEEKKEGEKKTWTETIEVAGKEAVDKIKDVVREGNVRKVIIKSEKGKTLLEIPMTGAVIAGGVITLANPILAAIAALAALVARIKIEIVREEGGDGKTDDEDEQLRP